MIYTIFYLIFTAVVLTLIFSLVFKNPGPWDSFWPFVGVLFLTMFAFSLWVAPMGLVWREIAWLDTLLVGLLLALLLGAAAEPERRRRKMYRDEKGEVDLVAEAKAEKGGWWILGAFFWFYMFVMIVIVITGLIRLF